MSTMERRFVLELGRGGMGIVYLVLVSTPDVARPPVLRVIKKLRPDAGAHPELLEMFLQEARIAAKLKHPNIVDTTDVGFDGMQHFIEMEYLEGISLLALEREPTNGTTLPTPLLLFVLMEALKGLHAAHELTDGGQPQNLVHRDVSPHNIFVTYDGQVKILDFGIAKIEGSSIQTESGVMKGKFRYMAPEQILRHAKVTRQADLFPIGVILWQALTGQRLWEDLNDLEIMGRMSTGRIASVRVHRPDAPERLDAICMKALACEPSQRYGTAEEMRLELAHFVADAGMSASSAELGEFVSKQFAERRASVDAQVRARVQLVVSGGRPADDVPALAPDLPAPTTDGTCTRHVETSASRTFLGLHGPTRPPIAGARARLAVVGVLGLFMAIGMGLAVSKTHPVATAAGAKAHCTTAKDCAAADGSGPGICRPSDHTCVALASQDCTVLAEPSDITNDATLWIGAMFPRTGPEVAEFGTNMLHGVELGRRDLAIVGGVPDPGGGAPRPIGVVACDDAVDPARAARHLALELHVPAVIGFRSSREVIDLAASTFLPNDVAMFPAMNGSDLITTIPHPAGSPRLVWRTDAKSSQATRALATLYSDLVEREVRSMWGLPADTKLRLGVVRPNDAIGVSFAESLFRAIRPNGKPAMESGGDISELACREEGGRFDCSAVVEKVLASRPHVMITLLHADIAASLIDPIESRWPAREAFHPIYVVPKPPSLAPLTDLMARHSDLRSRVLVLEARPRTITAERFARRFMEAFPNEATEVDVPGAAYDAFYVVAYAMAVAMGEGAPLTGRSVGRAIRRLVPPGEPLEVGPTNLFRGFNLLREGKNVDLEGAHTSLDFDLASGDAPADFSLFCFVYDESKKLFSPSPTTATIDARTQKTRGEIRCR